MLNEKRNDKSLFQKVGIEVADVLKLSKKKFDRNKSSRRIKQLEEENLKIKPSLKDLENFL